MIRFSNATQILQICNKNQLRLTGDEQNKVIVLTDASIVVCSSTGKILFVGDNSEVDEKYPSIEKVVDCTGKCILPGFVDGHTHPVWAGDRVHEFKMKLAGASYMDIHKAGGGIGFTVEHTKNASEKVLEELLLQRMNRMLALGTTTAEAKSGYGLECETEMKMLRVMNREAVREHAIDLSVTYLGAHSVPKGSTPQEAATDICTNQVPLLKQLRDNGDVQCDNIDVFLEKGVFEVKETRDILKAGADIGLNINFHGDELHPMRSGELAEELKATAVSHLEAIDEKGINALARAGSVAVLLPTTAFVLHLKPPNARLMIESGVPVALGSDFNPNAHCLSMPHTMNLACILFGMTINEAVVAATLNAAASIGRADTLGSIEVGKLADFVLIEAASWEHIVYEFGDNPITQVYKRGKLVFDKSNGGVDVE